MGKRVLLMSIKGLAEIFKPRGKSEAVVIRLAGPDLPDDAKTISAGLVPEWSAFGIVLESPQWSDLRVPGKRAVNGIIAFDEAEANKLIHVSIVNNPAAVFPVCAIAGYDEPAEPIFFDEKARDGTPPQDAAEPDQGGIPVAGTSPEGND